MKAIEWRCISYAPGYEVSSTGLVGSWLPERNFAKPPSERRILKMKPDQYGYRKVVLQVGKQRLTRRVCRLVAEAWHGTPAKGLLVRHLDGSRDNDSPDNLAWGTPLENSADMVEHGTRIIGSSVNTSRLTKGDVRFIKASELGHSELGRKFGVTPCAIWHIRTGRTWKHVV